LITWDDFGRSFHTEDDQWIDLRETKKNGNDGEFTHKMSLNSGRDTVHPAGLRKDIMLFTLLRDIHTLLQICLHKGKIWLNYCVNNSANPK